MRRFISAISIAVLVGGALTREASLLPISRLEPTTLASFKDYTTKFESSVVPFTVVGKLWIDDDRSHRKDYDVGKPIVIPRDNMDIPDGSIHHYSGAIRVPHATIAEIRRMMQDYSHYPDYFKPDVAQSSGTVQSDSTPEDEHYQSHLLLLGSTVWLNVAYDARYDCHYQRIDASRWMFRSRTVSVREFRDAKKLDGNQYPEGEDHGLLWRTNTYWFVRERDGGLDVQLDSVTLSRTPPMGFGMWGNRRVRDTVEKMLRDTQSAIESSQ